jgi:protein required for attachment to host cells
MGREESAHERTVSVFARDIAGKLEHARTTHEFDQLVLVAPPRFLGLLRGSLDDGTAKLVIGSLDKDLAHSKESELGAQLAELIRV